VQAKRKRGVLNIPTTEKEEAEYVYDIIAKRLGIDPWGNQQEYMAQVAYVPKTWSSVPRSAWVPNINWTVFLLVLAIQTGATVAIFCTQINEAIQGSLASCEGFCGSWIHLNEKAHSHTGFALFLLIAFRANSSYDRFWEGRKLWGQNFSKVLCISTFL
jgi:hypothetical protein